MNNTLIPQIIILNQQQVKAFVADIKHEVKKLIETARKEDLAKLEVFASEIVKTDHILLELTSKLESEQQFLNDLDYDNMSDKNKQDYYCFKSIIYNIERCKEDRIDELYRKDNVNPVTLNWSITNWLSEFITANLVTRELANRDTIVNDVVAKVKLEIALRYNVTL